MFFIFFIPSWLIFLAAIVLISCAGTVGAVVSYLVPILSLIWLISLIFVIKSGIENRCCIYRISQWLTFLPMNYLILFLILEYAVGKIDIFEVILAPLIIGFFGMCPGIFLVTSQSEIDDDWGIQRCHILEIILNLLVGIGITAFLAWFFKDSVNAMLPDIYPTFFTNV